jgi:hypothetical protein
MKKDKTEFELHIRPRPNETVTLKIPKDTLEALKKVAIRRDMSYQVLLKLYIGQGLRQDLARLFGDYVLETTAEVLAKHIQSEEQVSTILREIRVEAVNPLEASYHAQPG